MFPCVLCLVWDMTAPDTVLISISLLLERPKIFFTHTVPASSILQRPPSNENVSVGWNKCPVQQTAVDEFTRLGGGGRERKKQNKTKTLCFCYKKSKKTEWPHEPKVLTLNQIPLGLNWQAGPGYRLLHHILELGLYVPQDTLRVKKLDMLPLLPIKSSLNVLQKMKVCLGEH